MVLALALSTWQMADQPPALAATPALDAQAKKAVARDTETPLPEELLQFVPLDEDLATEVDSLIVQLGATDFAVREEATRRLVEIGAQAFTKLRDAYVQTDDLEIRLRIERITFASYMAHHVFSRKGFLGVSLRPYARATEGDPDLPQDQPAVRLVNVIEGTAAHRAGLEVDDIVVKLNGKALHPSAATADDVRRGSSPVVSEFSRRIAVHRPGETVTLSLYRQAVLMDVEIQLGVWAKEFRSQGQVLTISEALTVARQRFDPWWTRHFQLPTSKTEAVSGR